MTTFATWPAHTTAPTYPMLTIGFYCDADLPAEHAPEHGEAA